MHGINGMRTFRGVTLQNFRCSDKAFLLVLSLSLYTAAAIYPEEPIFNNTPVHITVVEGDRALLPCTVDTRKDIRLIWINPHKTALSLGDRRLIDDHRISVERPYTGIWNLLIRDTRYNDSGTYECRLNNKRKMIKLITLEVQVPPKILNEESSSDKIVEEGKQTTLVCNVTGIPTPNVTWYHRSSFKDHEKKQIGQEGEVLVIHNISRNCGGVYECSVNNGVRTAQSKAIKVTVRYPPEVVVPPPRRLGQMAGKETILECQIFAEPQAQMSWSKDGVILKDSSKHDEETYESPDSDTAMTLTLRIRNLEKSDFGLYKCTGSNYLGEDQKFMELYEIEPAPTTTTTTTTTALSRAIYDGMDQIPETGRGGSQGHSTGAQRGEKYTSKMNNKYNGGRKSDPSTSSLNSPYGNAKHSKTKGYGNTYSVQPVKDNSPKRCAHQIIITLACLVSYALTTRRM